MNGIVLEKNTQKDVVTDEVGVPSDVLRVWLGTHNNNKTSIKWTLGKNQKLKIIVQFWRAQNWSEFIFNSVYYLYAK